ncbi:hypothetical protein IAT38_004161 [Cryptococcus sp. DSM 104549]
MARPLRSLITLSQSTLPGPSSARCLQAIPRAGVRAVHTSPSPQAAWERYIRLPKWIKPTPSESTDGTPPQTEATGTSAQDAEKYEDVVVEDGKEAEKGSEELFKETSKEKTEMSRKTRRRGTDVWTEHRYSSALHKISYRKLNMISRQIAQLPVDEAIVQMQFSEKRASSWIKSTLALARDHAIDKKLDRGKLVVAETWVSKGPKIARLDIRGRGKYGIKHHPSSRIHVVLREGMTHAQKEEKRFKKDVGKVRSAGLVREYTPLRRKVVSGWTW